MGTTVTPDVDPDEIRTLDNAWQTFFDTTPGGLGSSVDKYRASGQSLRELELEKTKTEEEELERLRKQRASIEERRTRLIQLHNLDDELERINMRIKHAEVKRQTSWRD
jgi:transposase-like protein